LNFSQSALRTQRKESKLSVTSVCSVRDILHNLNYYKVTQIIRKVASNKNLSKKYIPLGMLKCKKFSFLELKVFTTSICLSEFV